MLFLGTILFSDMEQTRIQKFKFILDFQIDEESICIYTFEWHKMATRYVCD